MTAVLTNFLPNVRCQCWSADIPKRQHLRLVRLRSGITAERVTCRGQLLCPATAGLSTDAVLLERFGGPSGSIADAVVVIGAGIAGLAIAAALTKVGISAVVLERSDRPRQEGGAIALWPNAFRALDALGVAEPLRQAHPLLQRIELCSSSGQQLRQFSLDDCHGAPHEFRGVARAELLEALRSAVPTDMVRYGRPVSSVTRLDEGAQVNLEDGRMVRARVVVGADGARSRIAPAMNLASPNYAGYSAYRGVAEVDSSTPPTPPDTVRQLFGQGDAEGYEGEERKAHALSLIEGWSEEVGVANVLRNTPVEGITRSRIVDRWQLPGSRPSPGLITVAGDAAHPMTPNLGQGGCCAVEDAIILARELRTAVSSGSSKGSLTAAPTQAMTDALQRFEKERSSRVLPITIRSHLMGRLLQIPFSPVCSARNAFISKVLPVSGFMEHTLYDCGKL